MSDSSLKQALYDCGVTNYRNKTIYTTSSTYKKLETFKTRTEIVKKLTDKSRYPNGLELLSLSVSDPAGFDRVLISTLESIGDSVSASKSNLTSDICSSSGYSKEAYFEKMSSLLPAINIRDNCKTKFMLLDPAKGHAPLVGVDAEEVLISIGQDPYEIKKSVDTLRVWPEFNPYSIEQTYTKEVHNGLQVLAVNTYAPPKWRFNKQEPIIPEFISKLLNHLIPVDSEREDVLDWLHHAIVSRNDTILMLVGARGTGKGLLLNEILHQLIGEEYSQIVGKAILEKEFNGAFQDKRYLFFDEVNLSENDAITHFKAFANDRIAIEKKGVDSFTINNYTSMALASNDRRHIPVMPQERRFSIPKVADKMLTEVIPEQEINDALDRFKNTDSVEISQFGHFLLNRVPKRSPQYAIKGEYYFELSRLNMKEWEICILDYIISNGELYTPISSNDLKKVFSQEFGKMMSFPKQSTVSNFLEDYKHRGTYKIASVVEWYDSNKGRMSYAIQPDEKFLKEFGQKKKIEEMNKEAAASEYTDFKDILKENKKTAPRKKSVELL